ncbi:MAG: putative CDP-diacylglycerol--glycerol-3-phosphate 3-phosphatidyl-transferase 2 [Firmicutes bacterium ADurb.Bin356]|nr:MAG: putative CDP-diacylglycerol--glycerol-3-phosphate 3-phosphatidyl-transferase 2 [Firmicutes bacterium ADurb.Bin356]
MVLKMRHIPNILSSIRIAMVGVFVLFFVKGNYFAALGVYLLAIITDTLDGYLARRNNWTSDLGKVLDPLADKLMLIAALICFLLKGWIPLWLVIVVVGKELLMIIGGILLWKREVVVYADWFGKSATGFFNAGVIATMCKHFWPWIAYWNIVLLSIAMVLAVIALTHYARKNVFNKKVDKPASNG